MPPNETAPSFTDEDRARANEIVENIYHDALYHPARGNRLITRDEGENR